MKLNMLFFKFFYKIKKTPPIFINDFFSDINTHFVWKFIPGDFFVNDFLLPCATFEIFSKCRQVHIFIDSTLDDGFCNPAKLYIHGIKQELTNEQFVFLNSWVKESWLVNSKNTLGIKYETSNT